MAASDFFTVEVWSWHGLITHYVLFVIELATRRVAICGITTNPNEVWMLQIARGVLDSESGDVRAKPQVSIYVARSKRTSLSREFVSVISFLLKQRGAGSGKRTRPPFIDQNGTTNRTLNKSPPTSFLVWTSWFHSATTPIPEN
jgi:hypothetical protein